MNEENQVLAEEEKEGGSRAKRRLPIPQAVGFGIAGLLAVCLIVWLVRLPPPASKAGLVINEIVSDNGSYPVHSELGLTHWVELYNGGAEQINLLGYGLSPEPKNAFRYMLPEIILPSGGYLLIFFTGGTPAADKDPLCTGFGLPCGEEFTLVLADANHYLLDEVRVPVLGQDQAYARVNATDFAITDVPTPMAENRF